MKEKSKKTKKERYEDENYINIDKIKQTKKERYDNENYCNPDQIKETKLIKYGDKNYNNIEKQKKTIQKKYGVTNSYNINNNSYSKVSQELFWEIYNTLPKKLQKKTYFAELNKEFDIFSQNKYHYFYDFIISSLKLCVEFNGDYWHANPKIYKENFKLHTGKLAKDIWDYDQQKIKTLQNKGFRFIIIWESDFINNKLEIIDMIIKEINRNE